jgi:hypothetical protein
MTSTLAAHPNYSASHAHRAEQRRRAERSRLARIARRRSR